jgi:hypothetical protein
MNNLKEKIDECLLDDLVSGHLRGEQYRSALLALEAHPQGWRQCALAFLEEQALTQELKSLMKGSVDWSIDKAADEPTEPSRLELLSSGMLARAVAPPTDPLLSGGPVLLGRPIVNPKLIAQRVGVLAAVLLLSFTVGWMGAGIRDQVGANALNEPSATTSASLIGGSVKLPSPQAPTAAPGNDNPLGSIPNPTIFGNQFQPMDRQLASQLRELQAAGHINIETIESIVPVMLEDGSSVIVPVQQYRITPVTYSY